LVHAQALVARTYPHSVVYFGTVPTVW
jgi:hypothetical protein